MSNNLKTIQTVYKANRHPNGRLTQKRFDNYNRMLDMITMEASYYWNEGFNKMYGRYTRLVEPGLVTDQLKDFTLKINKQLRMTDFFYDGVSKKDLKLIRDRFKKEPINVKGYHKHTQPRMPPISIGGGIGEQRGENKRIVFTLN